MRWVCWSLLNSRGGDLENSPVTSCLWTTVTLMKVNLYRIFWLEVTLFRHPIHSAVMDIMTWTPEGDRSHWSHSVEWRPLSVGCFVKVSLRENFHPNEQMKSAFDKLQLNSSKSVMFNPERRMSRSCEAVNLKAHSGLSQTAPTSDSCYLLQSE